MILTDGRSNSGQVKGPARQLKNSGVVIFSVGIGGSLSMHELQVMASDPVNDHVITLGDFSQLAWLAEQMSSQTCNGEFYTHNIGGNDDKDDDDDNDNADKVGDGVNDDSDDDYNCDDNNGDDDDNGIDNNNNYYYYSIFFKRTTVALQQKRLFSKGPLHEIFG